MDGMVGGVGDSENADNMLDSHCEYYKDNNNCAKFKDCMIYT